MFSNEASLKIHMRNYHVQTSSIFKCDLCDKILRSYPLLRNHVRKIHSNKSKEKKFQCDICNIHYKSKNSLSLHLQVSHSKENFICEVCDKEFSNSNSLKMHMNKVHLDLTKSFCNECNQFFKNIKSHVTQIHLNEKCLKCDHPY